MKSRYVFAGIVTIALVLVSVALLQVVSANDPGGWTKSWDGGGGNSDWGTAANWNPDGVPGAADKVFIDSGSGVTISSGNQHIVWLHSHQPITVSSGGWLTLDEASQIANTLTLDGGTLTGAGDLAISGLFTWSGGTMTGTGATTANGGISLTTSATKYLDGRILNNDNNGTCNYTGSNFVLHYLGTFNNRAGATFNFPTDATIVTSAGITTFNNYGTFNRTTANGTAEIGIIFNNSGTVDVQ